MDSSAATESEATSSNLQDANNQLRALFPERSDEEVKAALEESAGDIEEAAGILVQGGAKAPPEGDELAASEMLTSDYRALLDQAELQLRELQTKENNYKDKYMGLLDRRHSDHRLTTSSPFVDTVAAHSPRRSSLSLQVESTGEPRCQRDLLAPVRLLPRRWGGADGRCYSTRKARA